MNSVSLEWSKYTNIELRGDSFSRLPLGVGTCGRLQRLQLLWRRISCVVQKQWMKPILKIVRQACRCTATSSNSAQPVVVDTGIRTADQKVTRYYLFFQCFVTRMWAVRWNLQCPCAVKQFHVTVSSVSVGQYKVQSWSMGPLSFITHAHITTARASKCYFHFRKLAETSSSIDRWQGDGGYPIAPFRVILCTSGGMKMGLASDLEDHNNWQMIKICACIHDIWSFVTHSAPAFIVPQSLCMWFLFHDYEECTAISEFNSYCKLI